MPFNANTTLRTTRSLMLCAIACFTLLAISATSNPAGAQAGDYPAKTVRIVVPYTPGGASDITARLLADRLGQKWSRPVVVENRAGASGMIGTDMVAKADPDGYTLALIASSHVANQSLFKKISYDTLKDFAPVTMTAQVQLALVVNPDLPVKNVAELIALLKANPGNYNFASSGSGSNPQLFAELFMQLSQTSMMHVPYKGSTAAHPDLLSGRVSVMFDAIASVLPHVKAGRLRLLAVCGAKRSALLPDVPTLAEAGVPGYAMASWGGILAPAGTPKAIVAKLHTDIVSALNEPANRQRLADLGAEVIGNTPEQFQDILVAETARYATLIRAAGIQPE
jgi:tripartite-type tricarboxylate transporter receptor subunit TctC